MLTKKIVLPGPWTMVTAIGFTVFVLIVQYIIDLF